MDKKEFERIKAEEKEHLRKLRALKQQHRGVSRQKKVLDALNAMQRPDLDATYEEAMRGLTEDAAMTEARLEIAMEDSQARAPQPEALTEADREKLRKDEAAALIRQMKAEMGTPSSEMTPAAEPSDEASSNPAERTIGRSSVPARPEPDAASKPANQAAPEATDSLDKTIGRKRDQG
ncbi:MAG: hypothetical protein AAFX41_04295 [Bacteroidota bacterium]